MRACITALCPTYGRFELLRDAVACFLLQTYRPRRLLVLNDAPEPVRVTEDGGPLRLPGCTVEVWNSDSRYPTLGHKRQALLTAACGDPRPVEGGICDGQTDQSHSTSRPRRLAAHWDDDDWYLPWHLQQCVDALTSLRGGEAAAAISLSEAAEAGVPLCVKPRGAWWVKGPRDDVRVEGVRHNVFEGQMAFDRRAAIELGGYSLKDSGQAKDLMGRFKNRGTFTKFEPELTSYCYRWDHGGAHVSACQNGDSWADGNDDFGGERPLIPAGPTSSSLGAAAVLQWARQRMHDPFQRLLDGLRDEVSTDRHTAVKVALNDAYRGTVNG